MTPVILTVHFSAKKLAKLRMAAMRSPSVVALRSTPMLMGMRLSTIFTVDTTSCTLMSSSS